MRLNLPCLRGRAGARAALAVALSRRCADRVCCWAGAPLRFRSLAAWRPEAARAGARDPALRLALLQAAGELAARDDAPAALSGGGAAGLARAALLPPLAWRAGKAAAALRFAALASLGALLSRRLLSQARRAGLGIHRGTGI
jgi:hypothetical protein